MFSHCKVDYSCHCLRLLPTVFQLNIEMRLPAPKLHKLEKNPRPSSCVYVPGLYRPMSLETLLLRLHPSEFGEQTTDTRPPQHSEASSIFEFQRSAQVTMSCYPRHLYRLYLFLTLTLGSRQEKYKDFHLKMQRLGLSVHEESAQGPRPDTDLLITDPA